MNYPFNSIFRIFASSRGDRSSTVYRNVFTSFIIKAGNIFVGLAIIPITIDYINPVQYGIWLTISSVVGLMTFMDIGLSNGLRNKLSESLALKDNLRCNIYISTTYALLTIISFGIFFVFAATNQFLNWNDVLSISYKDADNLNLLLSVVVLSFCLRFVVQIVNTVLIASHQSAKSEFLNFLGQVNVLICILIFKWKISPSLLYLTCALTFIPVVTLFAANIYYFKTKFKQYRPRIRYIKFSYSKDLLNLGGLFFVIQLGALILFQTDNLIIAKILGSSAVTEFNIVYKFFSINIILFNIILSPYWSAFTDAFVKNDYAWLESNIWILRKIWMGISFIGIPILVMFSDTLISLWIGRDFHISLALEIAVGFYVIGHTCLVLNSYFLNGIGKIKLQFYLYIFSSIVNIPLAVMLGRQFGLPGIVYSNVFIFLIMNVILWIQSNKILAGTRKGLWFS